METETSHQLWSQSCWVLCDVCCGSSLQNTAQRSVIPAGPAGKQDVDLLMWFLRRRSVTGPTG